MILGLQRLLRVCKPVLGWIIDVLEIMLQCACILYAFLSYFFVWSICITGDFHSFEYIYGDFHSFEYIYIYIEELKNVFFLMVALRPLTILAKDYNMNELYLKLSINLANIYYCKTNYKICPSKNIGFLFYVCIYYC